MHILYDSFKTNDEWKSFLRQKFYEEEDQELMEILANYSDLKDLTGLRNDLENYLHSNFGPEVYKTLKDGFNALF